MIAMDHIQRHIIYSYTKGSHIMKHTLSIVWQPAHLCLNRTAPLDGSPDEMSHICTGASNCEVMAHRSAQLLFNRIHTQIIKVRVYLRVRNFFTSQLSPRPASASAVCICGSVVDVHIYNYGMYVDYTVIKAVPSAMKQYSCGHSTVTINR